MSDNLFPILFSILFVISQYLTDTVTGEHLSQQIRPRLESTHLHQNVASLRRDLEQAVLQVTTSVLGASASTAAHFPSKERHFDRVRYRGHLMYPSRGDSRLVLVDRTRVRADRIDVADAVVSVVRLDVHHAQRSHRYLSAETTRNVIRFVSGMARARVLHRLSPARLKFNALPWTEISSSKTFAKAAAIITRMEYILFLPIIIYNNVFTPRRCLRL